MKMQSMLKRIKQRINEASRAITDEFYVGQDKKGRIRFLNDLEDAIEVTWHDKFEDAINTPCLSHFGLECPFCDLEKGKVRTRNVFAWTVYNYEIGKKQIFRYAANNFSPIPTLVTLFESYGTLCDRDYVITRNGTGFEMSYHVVPMDKSKFKGDAKPFTKEEIFKKWGRMYDVQGELEGASEEDGDEEVENGKEQFDLDFGAKEE